MTYSIRISDKSRKLLHSLAAQSRSGLAETLEVVLEAEKKRRFFQELDRAYSEAAQASNTTPQQTAA